jgi:UDP-N-acetylmuramyl pentapeptide synthase
LQAVLRAIGRAAPQLITVELFGRHNYYNICLAAQSVNN